MELQRSKSMYLCSFHGVYNLKKAAYDDDCGLPCNCCCCASGQKERSSLELQGDSYGTISLKGVLGGEGNSEGEPVGPFHHRVHLRQVDVVIVATVN
ncbi:hypothetical protein ACFX16_025779 [Malus domestica]